MAVPKRKSSRSRRGMRRAHKSLKAPAVSVCPKCKSPKLPHRICPSCGTYRGKVFLTMEEEEF
ncbi:50S ribosomal protein L32 [Thermodesulfatator autotrophicus]|uniref:Large ribosomal subunit protein bL32 n=1 Tax=Thermodesulfatator autotrophicus TaxID=1795632 RepID=A0A177E9B7_9BACT|nr:50S ribosomal protein L32 [Thermodesulfatator autotrophicus]OAG27802.1 50S ribosomal protein L32 [Thermodesulfatator autotrophicus]